MLFKSPEISLQWVRIHPKLKAALTATDAQVQLWRLPQITVTELSRTWPQNIAIYTAVFEKEGYAPDEAARRAKDKRSFHLVDCAADFRSSGDGAYSREDDAKIQVWLHEQFAGSQWEILHHDLGLGLHHHLAYRDFGRLHAWELGQKGSA